MVNPIPPDLVPRFPGRPTVPEGAETQDPGPSPQN